MMVWRQPAPDQGRVKRGRGPPLAFVALGRKLDVAAALPKATDRTNRDQIAVVTRLVFTNLRPSGKVEILGPS
jgi:hypothetical protein